MGKRILNAFEKVWKWVVWQKGDSLQLPVTTEVLESVGNFWVFQGRRCLRPQTGDPELVPAQPRLVLEHQARGQHMD